MSLAALLVANRAGARRATIYFALGMGAWYGLLLSGVHATLAGVLAAVFVAERVKIVLGALAGVIRRSADAIDGHAANGVRGAMEPERVATISVLSRALDAANLPIQRFEHMVHPWVAFGIAPVFALFNAGVAVDASAIRTLSFPVPLGIMAGFVLGTACRYFRGELVGREGWTGQLARGRVMGPCVRHGLFGDVPSPVETRRRLSDQFLTSSAFQRRMSETATA